MFKELAPYLRQRAVLMTVTYLEEDQIRVNVIPQKLKDGENNSLTTPLSVTGTAEDLDRDLPATIVSFVASHLQLKNSLESARAEMDAAAKAAQAEARGKAKPPARKEVVRPDGSAIDSHKTPEPAKLSLTKTASLFDVPVAAGPVPPVGSRDDEDEILAEASEAARIDEDEELDTAA